jgi:hypothetical protein
MPHPLLCNLYTIVWPLSVLFTVCHFTGIASIVVYHIPNTHALFCREPPPIQVQALNKMIHAHFPIE